MHTCLITSRIPPARCGVGDYTMQLAIALKATGIDVTILTGNDQCGNFPGAGPEIRNVLPGWRARGMLKLIREIARLKPDLILVQWVPFLYNRFGVNIWLPLAALCLRLMGYSVETMVHEPWVPLTIWQYRVTGPIQRVLLALLITASRKVAVSIMAWTRMLQHYFFWRRRDIFMVPIGSNIPLLSMASDRTELRAQLGIAEPALLLAMFSPFGSGKGYDLIEALWKQVMSVSPEARFIVIGATAEEAQSVLPGLATDARVHFVGYLQPGEVSRWLQSADIFIAPFIDGISARRGSALAAMAHGLPVVTTRGHLFDREIFEQSPLVITDYDGAQFAKATLALMRDQERRAALGAETRAFFEQHFAWPVIIKRLLGGEPRKI